METRTLAKLLESKDITDFRFTDVTEYGEEVSPDKKGRFRNTQRLCLTFPSGKTLVVDTICSGCMENTDLLLELKEKE